VEGGKENGPDGTPSVDAQTRAERTEHSHGMLAAAVRVVSGLTLLSRFAGLARDVLTAHVFGNSAIGSAFVAAFAIPNLFRRLFGEGALSAAFLPLYTGLKRDEPGLAPRFASLVTAAMVLVTGAVTLVIELVLLAILLFTGAGADAERALSLKLIMLMLPMMPMVCLTAVLGGVLQTHGRFGPTAAAPILLNLFQIAAAGWWFLSGSEDRAAAAVWIGAAAVAASVAQVVWSLAALRGVIVWTRAVREAVTPAKVMLRRFLPVLIGLGTIQLNTMVDTLIAMWPIWIGPTLLGMAYPLDGSSNIVLSQAARLYQFPLGVFGIAVATAVFPLLSRAAHDVGQTGEFAQMLRRGIRLSLFIALPASAGLFVVREDLIATMFSGESSGFDADGVKRAAAVLAGFAPAVWAYSVNHVLSRAFYARGDTMTPMRVSMAMVGLNLAMNLGLIWVLREAGLALATGLTAVIQTIVLTRLCRTRLGVRVLDGEALRGAARLVVATLAMVGVLLAARWGWEQAAGVLGGAIRAGSWRMHASMLVLSVVVGGGVYAGAAVLGRLPELRWIFVRGPGPKAGQKGDMAGMSLE
jgi:putative peptidoglycan lipid II flippase